jgi:hypothetical protein
MTDTQTKVLTGARGRVATAKATKLAITKTVVQDPEAIARRRWDELHGISRAAPAEATKPAKAARAARMVEAIKATKAVEAQAETAKTTFHATAFQSAMIKLLLRKQGATRPEMQAAAGSKTMPNAFFLDRIAAKLGLICWAGPADRASVTVYQFVKPGEKPTAFDA